VTGRLAKLMWGILLPAFACGCSVTSAPDDVDAARLSRSRQDQDQYKCLTPEDEQRLAGELFELINLERSKVGLPAVQRANRLDRIASDYACRMIRGGFFAHLDPETGAGPGQRAINDGYRFYAIGENLAVGHETTAEVMKAWMASDAHRSIIRSPAWTEVGLGVRVGGRHGIYWVQEFGDPVEPAFAMASSDSSE